MVSPSLGTISGWCPLRNIQYIVIIKKKKRDSPHGQCLVGTFQDDSRTLCALSLKL